MNIDNILFWYDVAYVTDLKKGLSQEMQHNIASFDYLHNRRVLFADHATTSLNDDAKTSRQGHCSVIQDCRTNVPFLIKVLKLV